jgi:hypothetical protein
MTPKLQASYERIPEAIRAVMHRPELRGRLINVSPVCERLGKRIDDYLQKEETQEFIRATAQRTGIPESCLTHRTDAYCENRNEVYLHASIMAHFCRWASPQYAVFETRFLSELMETGECGGVRICRERWEARIADILGEETAATLMGME